jgi:N-acetyl sugar amidotransferase
MNTLIHCTVCTLPETHETIKFDSDGVCNVCKQAKVKQNKVDWEARGKLLLETVEEYRGKYEYDCIVPFSGGKDSTYTLLYLVKTLKLKPLVIQFDHGFMRPTLLENNIRTFKTLGVDVLKFLPNWQVVKKLLLESLKRKGDFCWHCHTGIFSYPMQIALKYNTPLIFWGEPQAEYAVYDHMGYDKDKIEEVDERRFNLFVNLGITADDMMGMIEIDDPRDLNPFRYPKLKDLKKLGYKSVCLGSYIPWDVKKHVEVIKNELGWQGAVVEGVPEQYDYEKIECFMQGVRDYLKYIKRGYSRVTHLTSVDIRNSRLSRKDAHVLIEKYEGKRPKSLDLFLKFVGLTEEEFNEIALTQSISPYKHDFENSQTGKPLPDCDQWDQTV